MLPGKKYKPIDLLALAWRRRWVIVVPMILGAYAALIVSSRLVDLYQSEMLIQIVPQRVPDAYVRSVVTMRTEDRINTLSQQVMSRTELERLIIALNLYAAERARLPMQDVVERMQSSIAPLQFVRSPQARDADAFYIRFTHPDRDMSTRVTERLGALFIDINSRDRGDTAEATNSFLQDQLEEARRRLEEQERKVELFRQQNAGRLPTQLAYNMQAIQNAQLRAQGLIDSMARDRDQKLLLERTYDDVQAAPLPTPPPVPIQVVGPQQTDPLQAGGSLEQQLATARETLARYNLRLKPDHPDITRTKRLIADLENRIAENAASTAAPTATTPGAALSPEQIARRDRLQQLQANIESLGRQIQFKEAEERRLQGQISEISRRIEQMPGVESGWVAVTRDYDTQQAQYKDLLAKSEQSKVGVELEKRQIGEQFRILDPARPPLHPNGIDRRLVNATGALIGLTLGLLLAALLELFDTSFRSVADVVDVLKVPVIALVPYVATAADRHRERRTRMVVSAVALVAIVAGSYGIWSLELWRHVR